MYQKIRSNIGASHWGATSDLSLNGSFWGIHLGTGQMFNRLGTGQMSGRRTWTQHLTCPQRDRSL
jgi:hypothetical protein